MSALREGPTGEQLVDRLRTFAVAQGMSLQTLARQLSPEPAKWLQQLRIAQNPKPSTVQRIEALLAGRPVPPPPANNFQAPPAGRKAPMYIARGPLIEPDRPRVDRDPCPRCNVRRDIGCAHTASRLVAGHSARGVIA